MVCLDPSWSDLVSLGLSGFVLVSLGQSWSLLFCFGLCWFVLVSLGQSGSFLVGPGLVWSVLKGLEQFGTLKSTSHGLGWDGISLTTLTSRSTVITQMCHLLPLGMLDQLARPPDLNVATIMNDDHDDYHDEDDN